MNDLMKELEIQFNAIHGEAEPEFNRTISFRVTDDLFDEIDTIATIFGMTKTALIRKSVEDSIKRIKEHFGLKLGEQTGLTPSQIDDLMKSGKMTEFLEKGAEKDV